LIQSRVHLRESETSNFLETGWTLRTTDFSLGNYDVESHILAEAQRLSQTGSFAGAFSSGRSFWRRDFPYFEFATFLESFIAHDLERVHPQDMPFVEMAMAAATRQKELTSNNA